MKTFRVAVVGAGLGGLTAAALLAARGHSVVLFEQSPHLGGKAGTLSADGVRLDIGPTLLAMPQTIRDIFEALGQPSAMPALVEPAQQCHYVFDDDARLDVVRSTEKTADAVAQVWGSEEGQGWHRFHAHADRLYAYAGAPYLEVPFEGVWGMAREIARRKLKPSWSTLPLGTLRQLAERYFQTEALRQLIGRFATYAGASPYLASESFAVIPRVERAEGVHHVIGGMGELVKALVAQAIRHGVDVRREVTATVRYKGHRGQRFEVGPVDAPEPFDAVVSNEDPLKGTDKASGPLSLSGYVLHVAFERRLTTVPHHTVMFSQDDRNEFRALFSGEIPRDVTVYACHPAASDVAAAPPGRSGVYLMVNAPPLDVDAPDEAMRRWEETALQLREVSLGRLFRTFPEARASAWSVIRERTPVHLLALGAPRGSIYGFLPHGRWGPFQRPRARGRWPGLFHAGGGVHPGGGVPLVMLSGRFAAELADDYLQAQSPVKVQVPA